jgi:hypothetical protein
MARNGVGPARIVFTVVLTLLSLGLVVVHHSLFVTVCGVIGAVCGAAFLATAKRR